MKIEIAVLPHSFRLISGIVTHWMLLASSLLLLTEPTAKAQSETLGFPLLSQDSTTPAITVHFSEGRSLQLSIAGTLADSATVQWIYNGQVITGQNSALLTLNTITTGAAGAYYATIVTPGHPVVNTQTCYAIVDPQPHILNTSVRVYVHANGDPTILGFVVNSQPYGKRLLIRAVGPSLRQFGVATPLAQPRIVVVSNDGTAASWLGEVNGNSDSFVVAATAKCGAFPFANGTQDMAGIFANTTTDGIYSIIVSSGDGTEGTALIEIYEIPYN